MSWGIKGLTFSTRMTAMTKKEKSDPESPNGIYAQGTIRIIHHMKKQQNYNIKEKQTLDMLLLRWVGWGPLVRI